MLQYQQQQPSNDAHSTPVMRLRDDPQPSSQSSTSRPSRKRKSPPSSTSAPPPPHALIPPGMGHPPMYQYAPPDYAQAPPLPPGEPSQSLNGQDADPNHDGSKSGGRQLSQSKRAEQNRKAQRAFRERRDQYALSPALVYSHSPLLDVSRPSSLVRNS